MNRNGHIYPHRPRSESDPLSVFLQPPPDETQPEREARLRAEQEAKKRSDSIDKMLRDTERRNRRRKTIKVLLLGQSESGKSTTLKQFQLLHTPAEFRAERLAWRFVIYLNLLRSVRRILDAIAPDADPVWSGFDDADEYDSTEPAPIIISSANPNAAPSSSHSQPTSAPNYERYLRTFTPLFELEQKLIAQLSDPEDNADDEATHLPTRDQTWTNGNTPAANMARSASSGVGTSGGSSLPKISIPPSAKSLPTPPISPTVTTNGELSVPTTLNWKKALGFGRIQSPKGPHSGELQGWWEDPHDPVHTMNYYAPYITELWKDPKVRHKLAERRVRLEESSGFFLDEIDRITAKMYFITDDDVLKARLRTTGVTEHTFTLDNPEFRGVDWKIYDVGGARHQRQAWAPYFDDVDAIIFLAPISAFDQVLAEDTKYNRLQDSLELWKLVVSNKLLANVNIILFLNKCDLLKKKLESGVKLKHHLPGYRDRPNDYESVSKCDPLSPSILCMSSTNADHALYDTDFRHKFGAIHQSYTSNKSRDLYIHLTSVTDTRSTRTIITNVHDIILQANLKGTALM
ncbi:G-alpha-domain-containing protein [Trametopsis cervina]|nr:G-alpha-domain-containing protein [Trametopsis cervina]